MPKFPSRPGRERPGREGSGREGPPDVPGGGPTTNPPDVGDPKPVPPDDGGNPPFGGGDEDHRVAGNTPEKEVTRLSETDRPVFVSEYPYQSGTVGFLTLTAYLQESSPTNIKAFVSEAGSHLIQYRDLSKTGGRVWSYKQVPATDAVVQISDDGGLRWNTIPLDTPQNSGESPAIRFQRAATSPDLDPTAIDGGTGWADNPPSPPSPLVQKRDPVWATVATIDTDTSTVVEEWSEPFIVRGIHGAHQIIAEFDDGSGQWVKEYDPSTDTQIRFSSDQGKTWSNAFSLDGTLVKFQRSLDPPSYNAENADPGTDWNATPEGPNIPLWAIRKNESASGPEWYEPVQVLPKGSPWSEIAVEKITEGNGREQKYQIKADFRTLPTSKTDMRIHWRLTSGLMKNAIVGSHTYDRDQKPEFDGNLTVRGKDLTLRLVGDEDVRSYKVASDVGGDSFPDAETGDYYEGQRFVRGEAINLGVIEPSQAAYVTVTPYSDKEEREGEGDPQDPGEAKTFALKRDGDDYVLQGRYGNASAGPLTRDPSGTNTHFQLSENGGVHWSRSLPVGGYTQDAITENVYFQRGIGAPEIDLFGDTPGTGWSDAPPSGTLTMWMTRGPVDSNGHLQPWARWTTPVIVLGEVAARTLPPDKAVAQFSTDENGPWSDTYSTGDTLVRVSWDEGANWQIATMDTPDQNPTDDDGTTITQNVVNRFQHSSTEPAVDNGNYNPGADWNDFPTDGDGQPLWMISGLADLDTDTMIDDWSSPIRLIKPSETGGLIEFSGSADGPWEPTYKGHSYFHISRNNGGFWAESRPIGEAYFKFSQNKPASTTDPGVDGWQTTPPEGVVDTETPLWGVFADGSGGWTAPERIRQDIAPHGPKTDTVFIQYSSDRISWHEDIRETDKWMRQRIGDGFWTAPIRIKGEGGKDGQYRNFLFQASRFPSDAPKINSTFPDWDSTATYNDGDIVYYPVSGVTYDYWECLNDGTTTEPPSTDWDNVSENTLAAGPNWVDGPQDALDNATDGEIYIWSINGTFQTDESGPDVRQTPWDGPFRFNGVDAETYFIRANEGRSIKNSDPNEDLPLSVVQIQGPDLTVLTDLDDGPELYWKDPSVDYTSVTRDYDLIDTITGISSTREPTFTEAQIEGNLTLYLRSGNTDADTGHDTITLFDEQDGLSGGYVETPSGLVMTHYAGRDIDQVTPSSLPFIGTFVDSDGTNHKKDVTFTGIENASGNLEISWTIGGTNNSSQVTATVKQSGTVVTSPVQDPTELLVEFEGTDPRTDRKIKFAEQLQTSVDKGVYSIRPLDGMDFFTTSSDTLDFEVWRSDGDGTSQVTLSSGGYKLVLRPGEADEIVYTTNPTVSVAESDLSAAPNTLQLQDADGTPLDAVTINNTQTTVTVDIPTFTYSLDQVTESGVDKGVVTFEVINDPDDTLDTIKTRTAVGRNLQDDTTDPFGADLTVDGDPNTPPWTEKVEMAEKHNSFIEVKATFTNGQVIRRVFVFDTNLIPQVRNSNVFIDDGNILSIGYGVDEDTDELKVEWRKNSTQEADFVEAKGSPKTETNTNSFQIVRQSDDTPVRLETASDFADVRLVPRNTTEFPVDILGTPVTLRAHADVNDQSDIAVPRVFYSLDQVTESGVDKGVITFEIAGDPDNTLDTIRTRKAVGRNFKDDTSDPFGSDLTQDGNSNTPPWTEKVELTKKHNSFIEVKATFTGGEEIRRVFTFDRNLNPEVRSINAFTDENEVLSVGYTADEDTDNVKVEWRKNSEIQSDFVEAKDSPINGQNVNDFQIVRNSNSIPVHLKETSDFADIRLTPQTSGGATGDVAEVRVHANQTQSVAPRLKNIDLTQITSGSTNVGNLTFEVSDPASQVTSVEARRVSGGNFNGEAFDTVGNLGWFTNSNGLYEAQVDIDDQRNSYIEIRLVTGSGNYHFSYTFDKDRTPEITSFNVFANEFNTVGFGVSFDDDTDEVVAEFQKNGSGGFENTTATPVTQPTEEKLIFRADSLTPVRLRKKSDFVDVRLTPQTSGGSNVGTSVTNRIYKYDVSGARGEVEQVKSSSAAIVGVADLVYFRYLPNDISDVQNVGYKISTSSFAEGQYNNLSKFQTPLTDFDSGNNFLVVSQPNDQESFWKDVSTLEYVNSTNDQTFTIDYVEFQTDTLNDPFPYSTVIKVQENIPSGFDGSGDVRGPFYAKEINNENETPRNLQLRIEFVDGGDYTNIYRFGGANVSTIKAKGTNGLNERTDLVKGQTVTAQGLSSKDDGKGGAFYYDPNGNDTADGDMVIDMVNMSGQLKRISTAEGGGGSSDYTDADAINAINNDTDHGSTAQHDYYTDTDAVAAAKAANLTWSDLGILQTDVSKSDVGLGSVENVALSTAGWADMGISQSDVSKSDVGLGNVPNTNIAYASTIPADNFTSSEVSNLRAARLDDGTRPWTNNNYFDASDAISALENATSVNPTGDWTFSNSVRASYFVTDDASPVIRSFQWGPAQNSSEGVSVRSAQNVSNGSNIFTVESSGSATRFGVTQSAGAWARDGLYVGQDFSTTSPGLSNGDVVFEGKLTNQDYVSGILGKGYILTGDDGTGRSYLEVDDGRVRGNWRVHIFKKDIVRASNSFLYVSDASQVTEDATTPGSTGNSFTIYFESNVFSVGDELTFKDSVNGSVTEVRATVSNTSGATTRNGQTVYSVTATLDAGTNTNIPSGSTVVRTSGARMLLDASTSNAPVMAIWNGSGNLRGATGNLNGKYGFSIPTFGAGFGDPNSEHITVEPSSGFRVRDGSGNTAAQLSGSTFSIGNLTYDAAANNLSIPGGDVSASNLSVLSANTGSLTVDNTLTVGSTGSITNTNNDFTLDDSGLSLKSTSGWNVKRSLAFRDASGNAVGGLLYDDGGVSDDISVAPVNYDTPNFRFKTEALSNRLVANDGTDYVTFNVNPSGIKTVMKRGDLDLNFEVTSDKYRDQDGQDGLMLHYNTEFDRSTSDGTPTGWIHDTDGVSEYASMFHVNENSINYRKSKNKGDTPNQTNSDFIDWQFPLFAQEKGIHSWGYVGGLNESDAYTKEPIEGGWKMYRRFDSVYVAMKVGGTVYRKKLADTGNSQSVPSRYTQVSSIGYDVLVNR